MKSTNKNSASSSYKKKVILKSLSNAHKRMLEDDGFNLLELATAVGVVLVMVMIGLFAFRGLDGTAKQAAVNRAVDEVYDMAYAKLIDGDPNTKPQDTAEEYNLSQGASQDIIVIVQNPYAGNKDRIKVTAMMGDGDEYTATKITPGGASDTGNGEAPLPIDEDDTLTNFTYKCDKNSVGFLPILNIGPDTKVYRWEVGKRNTTWEEIEYSAPSETIINAGDSFLRAETREEMARTKVLYETDWDWSKVYELVGDWDNKKHTEAQKEFYNVENVVQNVSEMKEFKAGVEYAITYDGDVETFAAPGNESFVQGGNTGLADCLTSIDNLGNSTNLKNLIYIGGKNLTSVPDSIPSTVTNLRGAFENATMLNDPNLIEWDTSNVISMRSTSYNAKSFNQPIGNWDTSNLIVAHMTFAYTDSFNQNLNGWDTSNMQFSSGMFGTAKAFNNGCSTDNHTCPLKWRTDNLTTMSTMFKGATSFNQEIGSTVNSGGSKKYWNTEKLSSVTGMFREATSFNNGCAAGETSCPFKLKTDSLTSSNEIFREATSFNQNMSESVDESTGDTYWDLSNATAITSMFYKATSFNNGSVAGATDTIGSPNVVNWDFTAATNVSSLFREAASFNQDTNNIKLNKITSKNSTHVSSGLHCSNVHPLILNSSHCLKD